MKTAHMLHTRVQAQPAAPGAPATNDAAFTVGLAHRLDTGALAKAKVDHKGALSILYEGRLNEQVGLSACFSGVARGSKGVEGQRAEGWLR